MQLSDAQIPTARPTAKVYGAIRAVMSTLCAQGIGKDRQNAQQGYKFRGIDDVYNALSRAMVDAQLVVIPKCVTRECVERTSAKGGALFYITVSATYLMISAEDGSSVEAGPFYGEAMDSGDKATNKAMSAAYKYWAMQTFAIPTEGDNDADATTHEVKPRPNTGKQVNQDELDKMDAAQQAFIHEQATIVLDYCETERVPQAVEYIETQNFTDEEKMAIWALMPSKVKTAIRARQAELRKGNGHG